jgi:hypothetical protein
MPPEGSDLIFDHRHNAAFRLSSTAWSPPDEGPCWGALRCDAQGDPAVPAVVLDQGEPQRQ